MFGHIDAIGKLFATMGTIVLHRGGVLCGHVPIHALSVVRLHAADQALEHLLLG